MKKNIHPMHAVLSILLVSGFLLASCAPGNASTTTADAPIEQTASPSATATVFASQTAGPSPTATTYYTPTPDLRLKPEQWQQWPVIPEISPHAVQIYEQGLAMGNDPHAFSKVGDCQSIPESFLGFYDKPGSYDLTDQYQFLQNSIDFYAGSFLRESQAVRGGFNAAAVLLPLWADPTACNAGESPLECEIRIYKPSIVIISLEVWFQGRTPETYSNYLRQIIEYALSKGVLPVLATKADNVEGDHSINLTVAQLAYEYDIPMWNFWRSVQKLPNAGIDWERDAEGFHITVDAWNMRSFSALQVLDAIRTKMEGQTAATPQVSNGQVVQTPDPDFSPGAVDSLPYAQAQPFSETSTGRPGILLDPSRSSLDLTEKTGIFRGDLNGDNWFALASPGLSLLDLSPDGSRALVRFLNELYSVSLANGDKLLLSDQLVSSDPQPAYYLPDGRVAAILDIGGESAVYILANGDQKRLTRSGETPLALVPSWLPDKVYWQTGTCQADGTCELDELFFTNMDGGAAVLVERPGVVSISPDGTLAFVQSSDDAWNYLTLVQGDQEKSVYVPGNRLIDMAWSPDGSTLALSTVSVSSYTGKATDNWHTLVRWPAVSSSLYLAEGRVTEKLAWSADSNSLLVLRREITDTGFNLNFNLVDVLSNLVMPGGFQLTTVEYLTFGRLFLLDR